MSECEKEVISDLLEGVHRTLVIQDEQRKRGLNDYNLLTSVLKPGDEVRLHSRFIYSMINPNGKHYQGTLFLRLFSENVLQNCELDLNSVRAYKEWKDGDENGGVDLFITDGSKFVIIENKVYAGDQYRQIARYVKAIIDNYPEATEKNVFVYYLSRKKDEPDKSSLGKFELKENYMEYVKVAEYSSDVKESNKRQEDEIGLDKCLSGKKISYCNVTYDDHIIKWVNSCLKETCNLTNINQALLTYKEVVQHIIKKKENKVVTISDEIIREGDVEKILCARELEREMPKLKGKLLYKFFNDVEKTIQDIRREKSDYVIKTVKNIKYVKNYDDNNNCTSWFVRDKRDYKHVGITFDLSNDVFLCVMVAVEVLYIGVIPKDKDGCKMQLDESVFKVCEFNKKKLYWYASADINMFNFDKDAIDLLLNKGNSRESMETKIRSLVEKFGGQ